MPAGIDLEKETNIVERALDAFRMVNKHLTYYQARFNLLSSGLIRTYEKGTMTLETTYRDSDLGIAQCNPVIASSDGFFSEIYINKDKDYTVHLKTKDGVILIMQDIDRKLY